MQFRLTYEGLLKGASKNDTRAEHKHDIRREFHPQLERLWAIRKYLGRDKEPLPQVRIMINGDRDRPPKPDKVQTLAEKFKRGKYRFVPLVTKELSLTCGLSILFLRPDYPGGVVRSGDIDNRLKTLFDALRVPTVEEIKNSADPSDHEDPFYCLLEDDELITRVSVETDVLLQPTGEQQNPNDARLILTVDVKPSELTWGNIGFTS